jgi:hypothetical protein
MKELHPMSEENTDQKSLVTYHAEGHVGFIREMAFRGHAIDAETARRIHLVNEVYTDKESLFS